MNKQVKELVDELAKYLENTSDEEWETMPETSEEVRSKEDCREYSIYTLKHLSVKYNLALIDRKKPKCWYCKKLIKVEIVHDCGYSVAEEFEHVIPLAEALGKE